MKVSHHIAISTVLSALIWLWTQSAFSAIICFFSGIIIDIDHIAEFLIHHSWKKLTVKNFFAACNETDQKSGNLKFPKLYLFFHSFEIIIVLWIGYFIYNNQLLLGFLSGITIHLVGDAFYNGFHPLGYFFLFRYRKKFLTDSIILRK